MYHYTKITVPGIEFLLCHYLIQCEIDPVILESVNDHNVLKKSLKSHGILRQKRCMNHGYNEILLLEKFCKAAPNLLGLSELNKKRGMFISVCLLNNNDTNSHFLVLENKYMCSSILEFFQDIFSLHYL